MNPFLTPALTATPAAAGGALALLAVVACLVLLVQHEIATGVAGERLRPLRRALPIALLPIGLVTALAVVGRLYALFR